MEEATATSYTTSKRCSSDLETAAHAAAKRLKPSKRNVHEVVCSADRNGHFRELYREDVDFADLARRDPDFAKCLEGERNLDFNDPASVKQLTKTLLKLDFHLDIELPDDRLCPPVPVRHNYILWLQSLLDSSSYDAPRDDVKGLDIGTGASCIYPLLGCAQRPWRFIATDIDAQNLKYARDNVEVNGLDERIRVVSRTPDDTLVSLDDLNIDKVDFTMTNPPFYSSEAELLASAAAKSRLASSACTGAPVEMICDGGEESFVDRIFQESLVLKERVQWYTSMFGKASSLDIMVEKLKAHNIDNFAVTEFVQGQRTRRWAIGWSFGAMRPSNAAGRGMNPALWKKLMPPSTETDVLKVEASYNGEVMDALIIELMEGLDLVSWEWEEEAREGTGKAAVKAWSRRHRREMQRVEQGEATAESGDSILPKEVALGFTIALRREGDDQVVVCRWREGHNADLYRSFCSWLRGRLQLAQETKRD